MKMKTFMVTISLLLFFGLSRLPAQEAFTSTGGSATGTGGTAENSVGLVFYSTYFASNGSAAQGVQQPFEISVVSGVEWDKISLDISAFPNPTADFLTLKIDQFQNENYQLSIFDINGKLIQRQVITTEVTQVSFVNLVASTYILRITKKSKLVKTFKIIKTK